MADNDNGTNGDASVKDESPFPSAADMLLGLWRAGAINRDGSRYIEAVAGTYIAKVYRPADSPQEGDVWARRIEMLGDLYEGLRRAAEKLSEAGVDVGEENAILSDFITPKPFPEA